MTSETAKNISLVIESIVGIAFSIFMMYSMYKTKKAAEKIVETSKDLSETLKAGAESLGASIGSMISQKFGSNELQEVIPGSEIHFAPVPDITLGVNNILLNPETKKPILSLCCMDNIKYRETTDNLHCVACGEYVDELGNVLKGGIHNGN